MSKKDGKSFEEHLTAIEAIVDSLESGDLDLDKAMEQYEKGMGLIKTCRTLLKESKIKIELLKKRTEAGYEAETLEEATKDVTKEKTKTEPKKKPKDKGELF
ncbi:MAG: exodeoxyribonuclease VII small subunit [bacterium]